LQTTTGLLHRLRRNRRGVSNIIVIVLSFIVLVIIVSNVVLWSYQMNQLDWEKMKEDVIITNVVRVTNSSWFVTQSEYTVNIGSRTSGTYVGTQAIDSNFESFRESQPPRSLDINGTFYIDVSNYPLAYIQSIEIQLRYKVDDTGEKWYLKAYNWASQAYSDNGFNSTSGHTPVAGWNNYAVKIVTGLSSYVLSDGKMLVKVHDQGSDNTRTTIDIDFLGVRALVNGTLYTFKNNSSFSSHLTSLWVNNSTVHRRYNMDVYVNSGETFSYQRIDVTLPTGQYKVRAVTERGNIAIYTGG